MPQLRMKKNIQKKAKSIIEETMPTNPNFASLKI
jgi:hypothetical protein